VQTLGARLVACEGRTPVDGIDRAVSSMHAADRQARRRHLVRGHMRQVLEVSRIEAPVGLHAVVQRAMQGVRPDLGAAQKRFD
jgi:hypothetical protein